eukprot:1254229-Rhodomonas_salina.2
MKASVLISPIDALLTYTAPLYRPSRGKSSRFCTGRSRKDRSRVVHPPSPRTNAGYSRTGRLRDDVTSRREIK